MADIRKKHVTRRQIMKNVVIGGVATMIVLPSKWTKPVIDSVVTPALAQSSPTTTGTTVTTGTGTTTATTTGGGGGG